MSNLGCGRFQVLALILVLLLPGTLWSQHPQIPPQTPSRTALPASGWGQKASLLEPISEQAVVDVAGKIYSIAGITAAGETIDRMQVYDVKTDKWSFGPPLPTAVNHHMAAAVNGKIYVFGGQSDSPTASPFIDATFEFDPAAQQWRARAPMPTARSAGGAVVVNNKIYVAGGRPPRGHDFAMYDPVTDQWETLPDLPTARNHLVVSAFLDSVYVVGGRFEAGAASPMTDVVEVYSTSNRIWATATPMPGKRGGINGIVANGCLHVFGGEGNREAENGMFPWHDVYNFVVSPYSPDPQKQTMGLWSFLPNMPIPVHGVTGAAFVDGLIYLPGGARGQGGAGRSDLLQTYKPTMDCHIKMIGERDLSYGKNEQAATLHQDGDKP